MVESENVNKLLPVDHYEFKINWDKFVNKCEKLNLKEEILKGMSGKNFIFSILF